jgi:uncharacterized protein (DUF58 family)
VRLIGAGGRPVTALDRMADQLARLPEGHGLPPDAELPRHARVVLIGDLLSPLEEVQALVTRMASVPVIGHLLQVLDPAEATLPYAGRVRFEGVSAGLQALVPRVEAVREAYGERLAAQQAGLASICAAVGWGFSMHRTDHPPETALLGLYTALSPQPGRR